MPRACRRPRAAAPRAVIGSPVATSDAAVDRRCRRTGELLVEDRRREVPNRLATGVARGAGGGPLRAITPANARSARRTFAATSDGAGRAPCLREPTGWVQPRIWRCHGPRRRCSRVVARRRGPPRCARASPRRSSGQPSSAGAGPLALPNPAPRSSVRYDEPPLKVLLVGDSMAGSLGVGPRRARRRLQRAARQRRACRAARCRWTGTSSHLPASSNRPGLACVLDRPRRAARRRGSPGWTRSAPTSSCTWPDRTCSTSRSQGSWTHVGQRALQRVVPIAPRRGPSGCSPRAARGSCS